MKKYLKIFKQVLILQIIFSTAMQASAANDGDPRYVGELHSPVAISDKSEKIVVFFLKNNFKSSIKNVHIATGEIYYLQTQPFAPNLKYVWKVEGDQISSVFFYDWKNPDRGGRSMYILTETSISNQEFEGVSYSAMELPLISENDKLSLNFFPGDIQDSRLQNCYEGRKIESRKIVTCSYKDASSIKKYLTSQDKQ